MWWGGGDQDEDTGTDEVSFIQIGEPTSTGGLEKLPGEFCNFFLLTLLDMKHSLRFWDSVYVSLKTHKNA